MFFFFLSFDRSLTICAALFVFYRAVLKFEKVYSRYSPSLGTSEIGLVACFFFGEFMFILVRPRDVGTRLYRCTVFAGTGLS